MVGGLGIRFQAENLVDNKTEATTTTTTTQALKKRRPNIVALIIRIGFWYPFHHTHKIVQVTLKAPVLQYPYRSLTVALMDPLKGTL